MDKEFIDEVTKEQFKQYSELLKERDAKKKEYEKFFSESLTCLAGSRTLVRLHWSLAIVGGVSGAFMAYKSLRARIAYGRLDKKISKLEEYLLK